MLVTFEVYPYIKRKNGESDDDHLTSIVEGKRVLVFSMSSDNLSPLLLRLKGSELDFDGVMVSLLGNYQIQPSDPDQLPQEHLITCACDNGRKLRKVLDRFPYIQVHP